jgi:hypothetical protein
MNVQVYDLVEVVTEDMFCRDLYPHFSGSACVELFDYISRFAMEKGIAIEYNIDEIKESWSEFHSLREAADELLGGGYNSDESDEDEGMEDEGMEGEEVSDVSYILQELVYHFGEVLQFENDGILVNIGKYMLYSKPTGGSDVKNYTGLLKPVSLGRFINDLKGFYDDNVLKSLYIHYQNVCISMDDCIEYDPDEIMDVWEDFDSLQEAAYQLISTVQTVGDDNDIYLKLMDWSEGWVVELDDGRVLVKTTPTDY